MGGACHRMAHAAFRHDARFKERQDQPENLMVPDASPDPFHQQVMVDVVEAAFDVAFDDVFDCRGPASIDRFEMSLNHAQRIHGASAAPEAIRGRIKVRLEDGFQDVLERHLHETIGERGNTQRAKFARFAWLGDQPLPDGLGRVGSLFELLAQLFQEATYAAGTLLDLAPGQSVDAWGAAAAVAAKLLPGQHQTAPVTNQIEQIFKHLVGVLPTPTIQFALHVEDEPGIHRIGRAFLLPACGLWPMDITAASIG